MFFSCTDIQLKNDDSETERKHPFASMKTWQGIFLILNNWEEEGEKKTKTQFLNPDILAS